jgi:hypothetical protein
MPVRFAAPPVLLAIASAGTAADSRGESGEIWGAKARPSCHCGRWTVEYWKLVAEVGKDGTVTVMPPGQRSVTSHVSRTAPESNGLVTSTTSTMSRDS